MLQKTEEHFVQNSLAKILFKYKMLQKKGADFVHNSLVFNAKIFDEIQKFCKNVGGGYSYKDLKNTIGLSNL